MSVSFGPHFQASNIPRKTQQNGTKRLAAPDYSSIQSPGPGMPTILPRPIVSTTARTNLDSKAPPVPTEPRSSMTDLSGTLLDDRYALGSVLGAGGMGAVFEAQDRLLHRSVAIKIMRPDYAECNDYIKRFLREAQAASKIQHRNVVITLDYGEADDGLVYSVMELLIGQDLKQLLKQCPNGRLPWSQTRALLLQLASGLQAAHDQGVIHRDIKPANCFISEEDDQPVAKVVDFGIAKIDASPTAEQLTRTSQVLGTPSYIAPELVRIKRAASPRSDVYSLGVMAYRMLTGNLPFIGETAFEVIYRACTEPVPRLRTQVPNLPSGVEELLLEMLAKDPQQRPTSMAVVRQRLQMLPDDGSDRQSRGDLLVVLVGGSFAAALGVAWGLSTLSGEKHSPSMHNRRPFAAPKDHETTTNNLIWNSGTHTPAQSEDLISDRKAQPVARLAPLPAKDTSGSQYEEMDKKKTTIRFENHLGNSVNIFLLSERDSEENHQSFLPPGESLAMAAAIDQRWIVRREKDNHLIREELIRQKNQTIILRKKVKLRRSARKQVTPKKEYKAALPTLPLTLSDTSMLSIKTTARRASKLCGIKYKSLMPNIKIEFKVRPDGAVAIANALAPMAITPAGICVANAISKLRFPESQQGIEKIWKLPL